MWSLRVFSTFLLLCSVCGVFCVALRLPDQGVLSPDEKTCSGETCPEDDNSDSMPVHDFLELTDHEHVSRKKDESESANLDATDKAKDGIASYVTKDIILNKLLKNAKNAARQKPNKLQGPSLIARYVQGMRGALDSGNGNIKEENNNDEAAKESKRDDTLQNSTNDHLEAEKDANDTELKNQDLILNLTEKQESFLDDGHMDVQINATENENVTETDKNLETNLTNTSDTQLKNQDLVQHLTEKQDNMTNFLDDHIDVQINATENENVTEAHKNLETNVTNTSDTQLKNQDLVLNLTENQDNPLDFVTNFLDHDHLDVQINANATEHENVTEAHKNTETNVTDTSENDIVGMDVNVTENLLNDTVDTTTGIVGKQLNFLENLPQEDSSETVSASGSIESEFDTSEIEEKN